MVDPPAKDHWPRNVPRLRRALMLNKLNSPIMGVAAHPRHSLTVNDAPSFGAPRPRVLRPIRCLSVSMKPRTTAR